MSAQTIQLSGKAYVVLEREEYDRLCDLAKAAELPPLPKRDADGNYPAAEYAKAAIARGIIRDRVNAGLSQRELAELAGIRVETLCRIETGKYAPSMATMHKIDQGLKRIQRQADRTKVRRNGRTKRA